jgi:hypothetical protein
MFSLLSDSQFWRHCTVLDNEFVEPLTFLNSSMRCPRLANAMAAVLLYRCPYTGMTVQQAFIAEDVPASAETFETVRCTACLNVHLVSRSGKVLSSDDTQGGNN